MFNVVFFLFVKCVAGLKTLQCGDGIFSTPSELFLVFSSTPLKQIIVSSPVHAAIIVLNSVEFLSFVIFVYTFI